MNELMNNFTIILFNKSFQSIEHLLKPEKLNVLPEEPDATKIYDYWLKTFESFLTAVKRTADEGKNVDRLALLTNFLSRKHFRT